MTMDMEHATCNVIYVDRAVSRDRYIHSSEPGPLDAQDRTWETAHIAENVELLLNVFGEVHLCSTGGACLTQWLNLQDTSMVDLKPTIILIDTPFEDQIPEPSRSREHSPHSPPEEDTANHEEELYGLALLRAIINESYVRNLSKLVVPVSVVAFPSDSTDAIDWSSDVREEIANARLHPTSSTSRRAANRRMLKRCLDLGATDVMASPMNGKCITNLEVHAYRAHREAAVDQKAMLEVRRGRKRSWVGISEEKPFSYLREAMVSKLMRMICQLGSDVEDGAANVRISASADKQAEIAHAVGQWHFCAHSFTDDELVLAAAVMFKHALAMPELEPWRIPTDQLHSFLVACRAAYNGFVPYHNFRHVVDVLQATFHFLVRIGALPPYPAGSAPTPTSTTKSPIATLLRPFEALTLLVTAIGHDVGHPGVNNGFLVTLNTPLAQLYNDRSVLESFHCAAYSQILRRHWPAAFRDFKMRDLMISSILATDMGMHFEYMKRLGDLQDKLGAVGSTEGWNGRMIDEQKALACALLIKCADISNVARKHDTALQWMHTLSDEFSRQAAMETELEITSSLMAPPKKDMMTLSKAQLGFMNLFAIPLFQGVADILPAMQYTVDELDVNKGLFEKCVADEAARAKAGGRMLSLSQDGAFSPRTMSVAVPVEPTTDANAPRPAGDTSSSSKVEDSVSQETERAARLSDGPDMSAAYRENKEMNGIKTRFEPTPSISPSESYDMDEQKSQGPAKQRCSETTEGSSAPYSGDWASQATSATTGKMPLSPSTQGTSIVSRDSMDRPNSVPVTTITAAESTTTAPESAKSQPEFKMMTKHLSHDDSKAPPTHQLDSRSVNGTTTTTGKVGLHPESGQQQQNGRTLKKKGSRFRINPLPFIRRHLSSSPPVHAADTAG